MTGHPTRTGRWRREALVAAAVLVVTVGCGDGLNLVNVAGTVKLDGQPLQGARVIFRPTHGRPSVGVTDATGRYTLQYTSEKSGALPGDHRVLITTVSDDGKDVAKEVVPSRYNASSELTVIVDPGHATHDFVLDSK